jgi:hypothetical protein
MKAVLGRDLHPIAEVNQFNGPLALIDGHDESNRASHIDIALVVRSVSYALPVLCLERVADPLDAGVESASQLRIIIVLLLVGG